MAIEWVAVRDRSDKMIIGGVGFVDETICVMVAFFEDKDWNHDGKVDLTEKVFSIFSLKGKALAEVVSRAYENPDIAVRDPTIGQWRAKFLTSFGNGMIIEGAYKGYMAYAVGQAAGAVAGQIAASAVKSFLIKKGMEKAVEGAFKAAVADR